MNTPETKSEKDVDILCKKHSQQTESIKTNSQD
jgi:hypothetical protein